MIHALLLTFSENHKIELFRFCSQSKTTEKVASWLHSHVRSLYFVIKSIVL